MNFTDELERRNTDNYIMILQTRLKVVESLYLEQKNNLETSQKLYESVLEENKQLKEVLEYIALNYSCRESFINYFLNQGVDECVNLLYELIEKSHNTLKRYE